MLHAGMQKLTSIGKMVSAIRVIVNSHHIPQAVDDGASYYFIEAYSFHLNIAQFYPPQDRTEG